MDRVMVIIPHWAFDISDRIFRELDGWGRSVASIKVDKIPAEAIASHYSNIKDQPFFLDIIRDWQGYPALLAVYEGNQVDFTRAKEQMRKEVTFDLPFQPVSTSYFRIPFHASRTREEFGREWEVWRKYFEGGSVTEKVDPPAHEKY